MKLYGRTILLILSLLSVSPIRAGIVRVADNGLVVRSVDCSDGQLHSASYRLAGCEDGFTEETSREFSFLADGKLYSGDSRWKEIEVSTDSCTVISLTSEDGRLKVELIYTSYPDIPLVRKEIRITNAGSDDVRIEGVNVEDLELTLDCTHSQIYRSYGRFQALGPYRGDWDDPLVVVHHARNQRGLAIGNETIGILKRTSVFEDGRSLMAGTTMPDQDYPFRRWLVPGQSWTSAPVFTAPYEGRDYQSVVSTTVQDYIRKYMGVRVEQIAHKPLFVYNTWVPFYRDINETLLFELADAAAQCGIEEFIIDDGWQNGSGSSTAGNSGEVKMDWEIDTEKFPNGLKPIFDHIKNLGMKPGIWLSVGRLDRNSETVQNHPEWTVRDASGRITALHTGSGGNVTACMGTEWCDYIKDIILHNVKAYGIQYVKLDLAIVTSAYVYDSDHTGCYATDHKYHRDHEESYDVIYEKCMKMFDDLHEEAPDLFIDCTFETAGKLQLMDYGIAKHAEGNWLANVEEESPAGALRVRELGWVRSPALPATSLVIGNQRLDQPLHLLAYKSLTGTLPIMLGDPRKLSREERAEFRAWSSWVKSLEKRHGIMSFRQDLPGSGMPRVGGWDGFCRINSETRSGGLVGVFREGASETTRTVTVRYLDPEASYSVKQGPDGREIARMTGAELENKGFSVTLEEEFSGELFEIDRQ
ncbi:MAG: alpha-galactosidase [Bacteroidales bacterium]|nr:alpha-galactosidase [Candidatus Cacconaster equifaecalis]